MKYLKQLTTLLGITFTITFMLNSAEANDSEYKNYIVTHEILLSSSAIQESIPEEIMYQKCGTQQGFIYGNVVKGKIVEDNNQWIEIEPISKNVRNWFTRSRDTIKFKYLPLSGLEPEPEYQTKKKKFIVSQDEVNVYLQPNTESRTVLNLIKGEIISSSGKLENDSGTWFRFMFENKKRSGYCGINEEKKRVGWINSKNINEIKKDLDQSSITLPEIPNKMRYASRVFNEKEIKTFLDRGFFIERMRPTSDINIDDMVDLYEKGDNAKFFTSDLFLHCFHLIFSRMLQDMEEKTFFPKMKELSANLYHKSEKNLEIAKKTDNKLLNNAIKRNMWFFGVAGKLSQSIEEISHTVNDSVEKEIELIMNPDVPLPSHLQPSQKHPWLSMFREDYTQYKPRGHYTVSEDLKTYFRLMMHYGRKTFMINDPDATLSAIIIAHDLKESGLLDMWVEFDDTMIFLIGKSDSWSPKDYLKIMDKVFGKVESIEEYADEDKIKQFQKKAKDMLPEQKIVSQQTGIELTLKERLQDTAGFRFMGQRYTIDAEIFQNLISPSVGTDENPKNLPSALEAMAVLGSEVAKDLIPEKWWEGIKNYNEQFNKVFDSIYSYTKENWTETLYNNLLYTLNALFSPSPSKQMFMNAGFWDYKVLNSSLGFWTELKHDTMLYSAQPYGAKGDGGMKVPAAKYNPPAVKGYIEPNPLFFSRMSDLIKNLKSKGRGFITDEYIDKLYQFKRIIDTSLEIVEKQIEGVELTHRDYSWIENDLPWMLNGCLLLPRGYPNYRFDSEYLKMALVTDVATDAFSGRVLIQAVGYPQRIYVLVKDYSGGTRITEGYVFSYYEFISGKRWTNEEWREKVYSPDKKKEIIKYEPEWYKKLRK